MVRALLGSTAGRRRMHSTGPLGGADPAGFTSVIEHGDSPEAPARLAVPARHRWMARVRAQLLPIDHELFLLLRGPVG
jgi:hypothetical protein